MIKLLKKLYCRLANHYWLSTAEGQFYCARCGKVDDWDVNF